MERLLFIGILLFGMGIKTFAQGDLLITPRRVIFEGNKQNEELSLINIGKDTATYSISFRQYKMSEEGKLVLIEKPDSSLMLAEPYLRIFPRQITLAPGEPQVIMLQYRRKTNMLSGEYRSHLWFRNEKDYEPLGKVKSNLDSSQVSVSVTAIYGITIPVLIRTGELTSNALLSDLHLETRQDSLSYLKLTLNRIGNCSLNGRISVEYMTGQGKSTTLAVMNVSIYTTISKRDFTIKLNKIPAGVLKSGNIKVSYSTPDDARNSLYAEAILSVNEPAGIAQQGADK